MEMKIHLKSAITGIFLLGIMANLAYGQDRSGNEIISSMDSAAAMWNKGDLNSYMNLYAPNATMMMPGGRVGLDSIRKLYVKYYFDGDKPKQELYYDSYQLTMLGMKYALLTGRFVLRATNQIPERKGTFSLVLVGEKHGWRILHDHSG